MLGPLLEIHDWLARIGHTSEELITEANRDDDDYRHLEVEPLDVERFITVNECKEITNPIIFNHGNRPTVDGLLSEAIFGITTEERAGIYGYIDLSEPFITPFFYKIWGKLDKNLRGCIYETDTYRLDENGYLIPDPNGETGIPFLYNNQKKLGFKNTKKIDMLEVLKKGQKEGWLFSTKLLVIPPYYRDIDTKDGGHVGIGEVNKLYMAILNTVRALKDASDFGFESKGPSRGRIQDLLMEVYNWFTVGESIVGGEHTGTGIFRKFGILRRSVMGKTTDNSARLVISAPKLNVETRHEFMTDLDHGSLPLSAACACLYPFMIFHLNRHFFNEFGGSIQYPAYNLRTKQIEYVELDNPAVQFSDDRFDKEMNEFIHGYGNRFKPVTVWTTDNREIPLTFKGYVVSEEDYANGVRESGNIIERRLTWVDVLFMAANAANENRHYIITRYPIDSYTNQIYMKANISCTKKTIPCVVNGVFYKWYPDIKDSDIGTETSNKFIDTFSMSNLYLSGAGADYDGDQITVKAVYTEEANDELERYMNSKAQFIGLDGVNMRGPEKEAIQAMYNITLILPDDVKKITPSKEIEFG